MKPGKATRIEWDDAVRGLGVRVTPGGAKSYILNYRAGGSQRRMTIGRTSEVALSRARQIAGDQRRGEVLSLRWSYVDFEGARLNLPDSKTRKKSIPLNAAALALLRELPRLAGNPHVFPGPRRLGSHRGFEEAVGEHSRPRRVTGRAAA